MIFASQAVSVKGQEVQAIGLRRQRNDDRYKEYNAAFPKRRTQQEEKGKDEYPEPEYEHVVIDPSAIINSTNSDEGTDNITQEIRNGNPSSPLSYYGVFQEHRSICGASLIGLFIDL